MKRFFFDYRNTTAKRQVFKLIPVKRLHPDICNAVTNDRAVQFVVCKRILLDINYAVRNNYGS
jgi:hypothetical protein